MAFYIGLSILSNNGVPRGRSAGQKLLSEEARRILSQFAGRQISGEDILKDGQGRPFFRDIDADFNISHSGSLAAVSFAKGKNRRVGCDVEIIKPRPNAKKIAEEYVSVPEMEYILQHDNFNEEIFFRIWTLKECYLKLRGLSVFDIKSAPSFISSEGTWQFIFSEADTAAAFYLYELHCDTERYILAAAAEGAEQQPEIRWFSERVLDCRRYG
jgi:phosphopantetheinyl transferase